MTRPMVTVAMVALLISAACSASPAQIDPSVPAPLADIGVAGATNPTHTTTNASIAEPSEAEQSPEATDLHDDVGVAPSTVDGDGDGEQATGPAGIGVDLADELAGIDDLLEDLDDLLGGLGDGLDDLNDSFGDDEGDIE